jgi:Protein of unknown function (DUF2690)
MRTLKNNQTLRLLGIFGISLLTMLVILGGSTIIHRGFPPFATTAHAATVNSCATTKGTQPALCERQDPIVQGCVTDAQTLDLQTVFQDRLQTKPLGEVELRYSPTCKTYWIRTTAFVTTTGIFKAIHAILVFHNHIKEDIVGTSIVPSTITPYVAWTDMTVAPMLPRAGSGSFDLFGQSKPITIALKE